MNPFVVDRKLYTQFSELRRDFVANFVAEKTKILLDSRYEGINPYLYYGEKESVVMLVNGTLENFEKTEFFLKGVPFDTILSVDKDGITREVAFERIEDRICVEHALSYMSTATFRLIKTR